MSLRDLAPAKPTHCVICRARNRLSPDEVAELDYAIEHRTWPPVDGEPVEAVSDRVLRVILAQKAAMSIGEDAIRRHREHDR